VLRPRQATVNKGPLAGQASLGGLATDAAWAKRQGTWGAGHGASVKGPRRRMGRLERRSGRAPARSLCLWRPSTLCETLPTRVAGAPGRLHSHGPMSSRRQRSAQRGCDCRGILPVGPRRLCHAVPTHCFSNPSATPAFARRPWLPGQHLEALAGNYRPKRAPPSSASRMPVRNGTYQHGAVCWLAPEMA
jgi:hypothetical protein